MTHSLSASEAFLKPPAPSSNKTTVSTIARAPCSPHLDAWRSGGQIITCAPWRRVDPSVWPAVGGSRTFKILYILIRPGRTPHSKKHLHVRRLRPPACGACFHMFSASPLRRVPRLHNRLAHIHQPSRHGRCQLSARGLIRMSFQEEYCRQRQELLRRAPHLDMPA